jgi:putative heme-binding domain-containing protein
MKFAPVCSFARQLSFAVAIFTLCPAVLVAAPYKPFDLHSGDRVVLVGDTLIEREQAYGYLEERLTVRHPADNVIFRNLGWSADTAAGVSRASFDFDKPGKGFELLKEEIAAAQPTVVIVGYGMASSFDGEDGLPKFKADLNNLIDAIEKVCTNGPVRFVFLSPIRHENLGPPLPDPTKHNKQLELYTRAISEIATERKGTFVSLFNNLLGDGTQSHPPRPFTDDGIHLTGYGYLRMAEAVEKRFVWEPNLWRVAITVDGHVTPGSYGTKVTNLARNGNKVRFTSLDEQLVSPVIRTAEGPMPSADAPCLIQINGLKPGHYDLEADGETVATGSDKDWQLGAVIENGPQFEQAESLRQAIIKKNQLYFDRWRPQNETYLFGFRKYEQGQNAREIPMFDPLVVEQEAKIAELRRPLPHNYELVPAGKGSVAKSKHTKSEAAISTPAMTVSRKLHPIPNFEIAPGFEINLFAESPMLSKPIQMNFDPQGRLWVVGSQIYPQIKPGQEADDKVFVLEDTKGEGKADKSTVFVNGLFLPTGIEPGDDGVYVAQGTQLLHFKNDGTGKGVHKRIVLSGFGTEDTHHLLHTLYWGMDGRLYLDQSIYIHSHIETPYGVERLNSGGVWQFRPATMELGVYLRGFCNPWGHQFDEFGQSFVTDGAGYEGISYGIPGATYFTYTGMRREMQSVSAGNYPKFCGLELIGSRQFPDDWQGNAITCDFRAHRIARFGIEEKEGGYATREFPDLLRTTDVTFRPIDVKLGPDGALYIADWSNPIIQHGEVDFRDPRRDHEYGRIWRVTAKGRRLVKRPKLVNASNLDLLSQLLSPNKYNRQEARRVLTERGTAIVPELAEWTGKLINEKSLLQALWLYESIDVVEPALLEKLLTAKDGHVRAAATRVAGNWHANLENATDLLAQRITDEFPRVRIEAMRALAEISSARSAELVLRATDKPMDPFVDYAAWLSINDLARPWIAAVQSGAWKVEGHEKELEFALKSIEPSLAGTVLGPLLKGKTIPNDGSGPWIELIGQAGGEDELNKLFYQADGCLFKERAETRALLALADAARLRNVRPAAELDGVGALFGNSDPKVREEALRLAGIWKCEKLVPQILAISDAADCPPAVRQAAFESLRGIGGKEVVAGLESSATSATDASIRREAVLALAALDLEAAKQPMLSALNELKQESDALNFWRSLLGMKGVSTMLAKALPRTGLSPVMARAGLRVAREGGRNEPDLMVALTRGADLESQGLGLTDAEMKELGVRAAREGAAAQGELLFRRKDIGCVNCHAIGGAGGKVGPDLTSIGASAPVDYLIESVFYPNRKIKEGYHSVLIETKDGEELSGILVRENGEQLVLRNAIDQEIMIPKNTIKTRTLGNSLMPSGLVDSLSTTQQLDLFKFLSELGKPGPFDASKGNVARYWKLFPQTVDLAQFGDERIVNTKLSEAAWLRAFSLVDGRLQKTELATALKSVENRSPLALFAATRLQLASRAMICLQLTGATNPPLWIDGKPANPGKNVELAAGPHTIIVKCEAEKLPEFFRLESSDGSFLTN